MSIKKEPKNRMITMRVTQTQYDFLEEISLRIRKNTGLKVTRASVILKLMELGLPHFNLEFPPDDD